MVEEKEKEKKVLVLLRLEPELAGRIRKHISKWGTSISAVAKTMLENFADMMDVNTKEDQQKVIKNFSDEIEEKKKQVTKMDKMIKEGVSKK